MARAATTSDVFNAIAEPRRREIIGVLQLINAQDPASGEIVVLRKGSGGSSEAVGRLILD